jgi:hypothetical protein
LCGETAHYPIARQFEDYKLKYTQPRCWKNNEKGEISVSNDKSKAVEVWRFNSTWDRNIRNVARAEYVGLGYSHSQLAEMAKVGYLAYKDPVTKEWLDYPEVSERFDEGPWLKNLGPFI